MATEKPWECQRSVSSAVSLDFCMQLKNCSKECQLPQREERLGKSCPGSTETESCPGKEGQKDLEEVSSSKLYLGGALTCSTKVLPGKPGLRPMQSM